MRDEFQINAICLEIELLLPYLKGWLDLVIQRPVSWDNVSDWKIKRVDPSVQPSVSLISSDNPPTPDKSMTTGSIYTVYRVNGTACRHRNIEQNLTSGSKAGGVKAASRG